MPNDGSGNNWDVTDPADSALLSNGASQIRDLRKGLATRLNYEHSTLAASAAGGLHLQGSAMPYVGESAPTTRPDGVTSFTTADLGRMWFKASTGIMSVLTATTPTWTPISASASTSYTKVAVIQDQKSAGTDGGDFTSGSWQQRVLNTIAYDPSSIVLSNTSNQFGLGAGTYLIQAKCPALQVGNHQARLSIPSIPSYFYGTAEYNNNTSFYSVTSSVINAVVVLGSSATFQIDHRCQVTKTFQGFGIGNSGNFGNIEVYTTVTIQKLQ